MLPPTQHVVVLAYPDPQSFNAAIARTYCDTVREYGQRTILRDLYRMNFDPVLRIEERPGTGGFRLSPDVEAEIATLRGSDAFIFVSPIWFGMPPAMMKGYVDRVIGAGVTARQVQDQAGTGLLTGAYLFNITTSGAREAWLDEQRQLESLRELSSRYLFRAFAMKTAETLHIGGIVEDMPKRVADEHLHQVRERARRICAHCRGPTRNRDSTADFG